MDDKKDDGVHPFLKLDAVDWYSEAAEKYQKEAVESWKNLPPDAVFGATDRCAVGITAMEPDNIESKTEGEMSLIVSQHIRNYFRCKELREIFAADLREFEAKTAEIIAKIEAEIAKKEAEIKKLEKRITLLGIFQRITISLSILAIVGITTYAIFAHIYHLEFHVTRWMSAALSASSSLLTTTWLLRFWDTHKKIGSKS